MRDSPAISDSPELKPDRDGVLVVPRMGSAANHASRCKHFTGTANSSTCKAGVEYEAVRLRHAPIRHRMAGSLHVYEALTSYPCMKHRNYGGATCPKAEFPTAAECAAHEAEFKAGMQRMFTARAAIVAAIEAGGPSRGSIRCPNCASGMLAYSRASNGHIWAKCSTEGCAVWME